MLIESTVLIIIKVETIFYAVLMIWVGRFGMPQNFNNFSHKKVIKDKSIVHQFIPMDHYTLQVIWVDGGKFGT